MSAVHSSHPIANFLDFADQIRKDAWERYQRAGEYPTLEELAELDKVAIDQGCRLDELCLSACRDVSDSPDAKALWGLLEELQLAARGLAYWEHTFCGPEVDRARWPKTIAFFGENPTKEEEAELFKQESLRQLRVVRWKHFSRLKGRFEAAFKDALRLKEAEASTTTPPPAFRSKGIPLDEANVRVREWLLANAKVNPDGITRDAVSKGTGVSGGQVSNTSAWKAFKERRDADAKPVDRKIPLTSAMRAAIPSDCERPDELAALMEEQKKDMAEQDHFHNRRHGPS